MRLNHLDLARYGRFTAVDGIAFRVEPGQVLGFLGPNGAGKSTSMRLMVGLDRPTAGEVTIAGRPFAEHRAPRIAAHWEYVMAPLVSAIWTASAPGGSTCLATATRTSRPRSWTSWPSSTT